MQGLTKTHTNRSFFFLFSLFIVSLLVLAGCGKDSSDDSTTQLGAVTGLTVTPGNNQNSLTWDALEGAVSYNIYWEQASTARTSARVADCNGERLEGITDNPYTQTGLTNGVEYNYGVTGVDADGNEGECGNGEGNASGTPVAAGSGSGAKPKPKPKPAPAVYGCTDPAASNYNPNATVDDGSCTYPPPPVNGACGTASGKTYLVADTTFGADTFCAVGASNPVTPLFPAQGATTNWTCLGVNGGTDAVCSASRNAPIPVNGVCGTAHNKTYLYTDTTFGADTFCTAGTPNPNPPAFPAPGFGVIWSCDGVNGGTNTACNAQRNRDLTPPVTTVALAEVSKTLASWAGSATINEAGTGYCTALAVGSPPPTAAEVKADNNVNKAGIGWAVVMNANATANCTVTGLSKGTTYDFYFVAEDGIPNLQADADVSGPVTATISPATTQFTHGISSATKIWTLVATDMKTTGWCVAVPRGGLAPTSAEVEARAGGAIVGLGGTVNLDTNTTGICTITGLTANTIYDLYFVARQVLLNVLQATPVSLPNISTGAVRATAPAGMVASEGGCFMMGNHTSNPAMADELPLHPVCLSGFFIDATEVTQMSYDAWGGDTAHPGHFNPGVNNPAEMLDWSNASSYCQAMGKRLPTEAEWEFAASLGAGGVKFNYGAGSNGLTCGTANGSIKYFRAQPIALCVGNTVSVGSYAPNFLGLFDMSGNVSEFVSDWYSDTYYSVSPVKDPTGPATGTRSVSRGGSYQTTALPLTTFRRVSVQPTIRSNAFGFRCVRN